MISPIQYLLSEKQTVQRFLDETPLDEVLERNSWIARLSSLDEEIEAENNRRKPARSIITYKGPSVVGSYGVASAFGLAATRAYTNLVQQVAAQSERFEPLGARGSVPNSKKNDLLVVGPAFGSFGFELEEQLDDQLTIDGRTAISSALDKTQALLQGTLQTDDELTEVVTGIDPRAITALRLFLNVLVKNEAVCAVETDQTRFHFDKPDEVASSLKRLDAKNIHRQELALAGEFRGMRPGPRDFEFRREDTGDDITGKIDLAVSNIEAINQNLGRRAQLPLVSYQIGNGRPRYLLVQEPQWL